MRVIKLLLLLLAVPAGATPLQDQYNAAQEAFDAGRMAEARDGFAAILPRLDGNPRTVAQAAVVRARLGSAAFATHDAELAAVLLARAVAVLPAGGDDWQAATLDLGRSYEVAVDYEQAAAAYRTLLANPLVKDEVRLTPIIGLVRVLTFSDPDAARRYADDALARAARLVTTKKNDTVALLQSLRGRIELNDGKPAEARIWFEKALASAGGLGTRVNVADIRIRGDLALAAYLQHKQDDARKYLAYTGSGQLPDQGFELGADMPLPACAPVGEVRRDDMAIVEFAITDDGQVQGVVPVYVTRRGGPELAFAKAVRTWSWRPEAAKALPGFWRQAVRVELRCANQGPDAGQWGPGRAVEDWLAENAPEPMPDELRGDAATLPLLRAELARRTRKFGSGSPQLLPVLIGIGANSVVPLEEARSADDAALAIARASTAPQDLALYFRMQRVRHSYDAKHVRERRAGLEDLLASFDKENLGQSRGAALVAAHLGADATYRNQPRQMEAAYRRILATPLAAMPDGDPLRQTARIQLASLEAASSRLDTARTLLAETGLSAEQCSLFPITPVPTNRGGGGSFPDAALQWHFEGNVRVAFDLDATGKPIDVRTVIASPPLVFSESTEALARGLRYKPIFRDGAAVGCSDLQKGVRYRIQ